MYDVNRYIYETNYPFQAIVVSHMSSINKSMTRTWFMSWGRYTIIRFLILNQSRDCCVPTKLNNYSEINQPWL